MFRYLVLGLLRDRSAYHGYALMKAYRERSGVSISTGNFYRELQRLVADGLVQTVPNPPDADARRAPYEITDEGVASFEAWLMSTPTNFGSYDDELSSRAVFVGATTPETMQRLLDRWREAVWIFGKTLEREREQSLEPVPTVRFNPRQILLARRLKHVAADLEFIEELRTACLPKPFLPPPVDLDEPVVAERPMAKQKRSATARIAERRQHVRKAKRRAKATSRRK
jgi:DNA-binding PadR family transcriptional regulator